MFRLYMFYPHSSIHLINFYYYIFFFYCQCKPIISSCILAEDPLEIPKCWKLLTFHYNGFWGSKDELHLKSILQRARVLKSMKISSYRLSKAEKIRVLKKLLKFPRLSRTCQIVFKKKIQVKFMFFNFILFSKHEKEEKIQRWVQWSQNWLVLTKKDGRKF